MNCKINEEIMALLVYKETTRHSITISTPEFFRWYTKTLQKIAILISLAYLEKICLCTYSVVSCVRLNERQIASAELHDNGWKEILQIPLPDQRSGPRDQQRSVEEVFR